MIRPAFPARPGDCPSPVVSNPSAADSANGNNSIGRCRALGDFGYDLDVAERLWDEAMRLPGAKDRPAPRWYHGDLTAENLLVRGDRLGAVLDFGALSVGDPAVDLVVAWEVLDQPSREIFRKSLGVDDATWLRGRAWALSLTFMIWYYWATMPQRRARSIAVAATSWPTPAISDDAGFPDEELPHLRSKPRHAVARRDQR